MTYFTIIIVCFDAILEIFNNLSIEIKKQRVFVALNLMCIFLNIACIYHYVNNNLLTGGLFDNIYAYITILLAIAYSVRAANSIYNILKK